MTPPHECQTVSVLRSKRPREPTHPDKAPSPAVPASSSRREKSRFRYGVIAHQVRRPARSHPAHPALQSTIRNPPFEMSPLFRYRFLGQFLAAAWKNSLRLENVRPRAAGCWPPFGKGIRLEQGTERAAGSQPCREIMGARRLAHRGRLRRHLDLEGRSGIEPSLS